MLDRRDNGRQRILDGAADILDGGRLGDFTVDSLARTLHMSKSTLYKYFESKDHVVIALVEGACRDTMRALQGLDLAAAPSARAALDALADEVAVHVDRIPAAILLAITELPASATQTVEEVRRAVRELVEASLMRGVRSREFSVPHVGLAAVAYLGGLEEGIMASARGVGGLRRSDAARAVHRMLVDGLAPSS